MRRSTVTAEGESNTFGTACTSTVGLKLSLSQPSGPIGWSELSWLTKLALSNVDGFCHELARTVVVSGPLHSVGLVRNARCGACDGQRLPDGPPNSCSHWPRSPSWLESAGTPQKVSTVPVTGNPCDELRMLIVSP